MFVLDASAALSWCLEDEASAQIDETLSEVSARGAHVPLIWPLEVSSALLQATRRKRLTVPQMKQKLALLAALPLTSHVFDMATAFSRLLDLSLDHALTVYDSTYLDLAARLQMPLVTLDRDLGAAARKLGLRVIA